MQSSLPAGWLAFTGRASNPLDRYKRFQIVSSSFSGFILAQGKFHVALSIKPCVSAGQLFRIECSPMEQYEV
jgi:hypothetical protein